MREESHSSLSGKLVLAFDCVVRGKEAAYISGPITTGQRFVEWYAHTGHSIDDETARYREGLQDCVISMNERDILFVATKCRAMSQGVVIEPTGLQIESWKQGDFYEFWCTILEKYCNRMIVVDGWQFSVGCSVEFNRAVRLGIPVEDVRSQRISASLGRAFVLDAASHIDRIGSSLGRLNKLAEALRESIHD